MTSKSEKKSRKAIVDAIRARERADLRDSMPLPVEALTGLINHLESSLADTPCDHTLNQARAYLESAGLKPDAIIPWLDDHGGFCDCEVVYNVAEVLDEITNRPPLVVIPPKSKEKRPELGPVVNTGFGVTLQIAAP